MAYHQNSEVVQSCIDLLNSYKKLVDQCFSLIERLRVNVFSLHSAYISMKVERDQLLETVAVLEQKLAHRHNERGAGRKSLNPAVVEKILQYRAAGMTIRAVADELGISTKSVQNYSLGLGKN